MEDKYKIIRLSVSEIGNGPIHKDNIDPEKEGPYFEICVEKIAKEMKDYIRKFSTYKGTEIDASEYALLRDKDHKMTLEFTFSILHPDNIDRGK